MDLYWSWVPGLPRKLYWPVRVISWDGLKVKVFCKADNAILQFCSEYYSKSISDETDINENADDPMIDAGEPKDDEGVSKTIKSENCCIYDRQVALLCHKFHDVLMDLLALAIEISSCCKDRAVALARELKHIYIHLPNLDSKKLLLHSIESELLLFCVVELILECEFDDTQPLCEFSLDAVMSSFCQNSQGNGRASGGVGIVVNNNVPHRLVQIDTTLQAIAAVPQIYTFSPQLTPEKTNISSLSTPCSRYTPVQVEELTMLQYLVTKSYIQVAKGKYDKPLHGRSGDASLGYYDEEILQKDWTGYMNDVQKHIHSLSGELSWRTTQYLMMMECLADCV